MFKTLKQFNSIVVSGPQRAGTRFVAKAIAYDTEKTFIDEKDINFHDFRLLEWYLRKNCVIQCPGLCHLLHNIKTESTLIVMVNRPIEEILASENRRWDKESMVLELFKYGYSNGIISRIKYEFWNKTQKAILAEKAREVNYHDMEGHALFKNKGEHGLFRWDQTQ